jgi:hypothetical protein
VVGSIFSGVFMLPVNTIKVSMISDSLNPYFRRYIMNIKLNVLTAAILAGFSSVALSDVPPEVPHMYHYGPASLQFQNLNLSDAERAGYALAEGIMQMAEATILAKASCSAAAGEYDVVNLFASGDVYKPETNSVTVLSPGGSFTLQAKLHPINSFYGQTMTIFQPMGGYGDALAGTKLKNFYNDVSFNAAGTMMTGEGKVEARGVNNIYDLFQLKVIKDFYHDDVYVGWGERIPVIYDWGLQSVSKLGYPLNKYWQRSKSLRDDGFQGHTHFVKDRLVGSSPCHIDLSLHGSNNADFFQQNGTLTIESKSPNQYPVDPLLGW